MVGALHVMSILLPLYTYPNNCSPDPLASGCAWAPYFQQMSAFNATTNNYVNWTVVINPNNGPQTSTCPPDVNYIAAMNQLNKYPRVRKIGYIDSAFGTMPAANYTKDVKAYASWKTCTKGNTQVDGIFVDDMLSDNTTANQNYYKTLYGAIQTNMPSTKGWTMLNPGGNVALPFYSYADSIITFEEFAQNLNASGSVFNSGKTYSNTPRQKQAIIIHDYNSTVKPAANALNQQQLVDNMAQQESVGHLFVTNGTLQPWIPKKGNVDAHWGGDPYNMVPQLWKELITSINATNYWMASHAAAFSG